MSRSIEMVAMPPPATWVILDRLALVREDGIDAFIDASIDASLSVTSPPGVSRITVHSRINPDDPIVGCDKHPYVVAADTAGLLLLRINGSLSVGIDTSPNPQGSLVVVRDFLPLPVTSAHGDAYGRGSVVPSRGRQQPPISNTRNVGLVSHPGRGGADYIVAELHIVSADRARLRYFRSGTLAWAVKVLPIPKGPNMPRKYYGDIDHDFHDVVSHDGKLWWVNLSFGLLSCDPFDDHPVLSYTALPVANLHWPLDIERNRLVSVSGGKLRYVEMTRPHDKPLGATRVLVRTLVDVPGGSASLRWHKETETEFEQIWATEDYKLTRLPVDVPFLAAVHPRDPNVLYFFLGHRIFSVNVRENSVLQCALKPYGEDLPPPLWWRYILAWELPPSLAESRSIRSTLLETKQVDHLGRHLPTFPSAKNEGECS